jgi:1-acyl-sn-glycerol-3-phosphate acyltransferase
MATPTRRAASAEGRPAARPANAGGAGGAGRERGEGVFGFIGSRASRYGVEAPSERMMRLQMPVWNLLMDRYFRLETEGWQRLPDPPCLLVGVHSGGSLTMDAWTLVAAWYRRFGRARPLHGTAHDVLMATPGLGDYFRAVGVLPASRRSVSEALAAGHDVVVWPGGEQDAMRSWRRRDRAVLAGRKGFVKQAIRSRVPLVPVATVGGHDTCFIVSEGRFLADALDRLFGLKSRLRGATLPIMLGFPFGLTIETVPTHLPLPAKIRTELLDPIELDSDPARAQEGDYVDAAYRRVETAIQAGMDRLAARRSFPIFG